VARHNRKRRPRDPVEREHAEQREAGLITKLTAQAQELHEMEAIAANARARLRSRAVKLAEDRELDITDIAKATGMSRDTIHRLLRQRDAKRNRHSRAEPMAAPQSTHRVGQRVVHSYHGEGTIEHVEGQVLSVRFVNDPGQVIQMLGGLATLQLADPTEVPTGDAPQIAPVT
jgi:predicted DNA-binding transcriptional regulator AlpA